jgi:hypothetical protein
MRRGYHGDDRDGCDMKGNNGSGRASPLLNHGPTFIFGNDTAAYTAAEAFAKRSLLLSLHQNLELLANMARVVPHFPSPGIEFSHVLGISQ